MSDEESSVRVAVRIRPQIARELIDMCRVCTSVTPGEPQITLSSDRSFTYDFVFDIDSTQDDVYQTTVMKLVDGALEGYNATVLAYGQTGSGKTYTMGTGFDVDVKDHQIGILPRAIHHLFNRIREKMQESREIGESPPEFKVDAQFMELYNDDIYDLLDPTMGYIGRTKGMKIHEDHNGCIYMKGMTQQVVGSAMEALHLLRQGALSRTTGATQMNSQSSRSHAIFTLLVQQQKLVKAEDNEFGKSEFATLTSKFHFVDLAGSERLKRTQATGERAKEGISINAGLLALGNVISALGDKTKKSTHVPYRDSKLTRLLQDSLGGNSQTVMIACVSPSDSDFMETLNTLNYANRARNIKNKVTVNQDKSSRTIALLRQQIQDLQLELLEYKQGKRLVSSDGVEVVNDMCSENILLQTETNNLRTRLKAMQDTIDTLSQKNTNLLAEKATSAWLTSGESSDVTELVTGYLKEIEELRAKVLESEAVCQQLRKSTTRQALVLSPTNHNLSFSDTSNLIAEAKRELSRDYDALTKRSKREKNGNEDIQEEDTDNSGEIEGNNENDDDTSSEESELDDDSEERYGLELAELSSDISMKQKLIDELERSQQKMLAMRQHYEDKLLQLQDLIKATQDERDKVLASIGHQSNPTGDKVRKVKEDYEKRLNSMKQEMKRLESAKKEHARLLREQTAQTSQLRTLKAEVEEMKRNKVNLIKKMKEESQRHKDLELKRTREIAVLKKESRKRENQIKTLQAENRVKEAVLRRRNEEVSALRNRSKLNMSNKAAGRLKNRPAASVPFNHYSPKLAKNKWQSLEKSLQKIKFNKKAVTLLERDMERLLAKREGLNKELENLTKKRDSTKFRKINSNEMQIIEEQIESAKANMDYLQDRISDCQHNIIEIEGSKDEEENSQYLQIISGVGHTDEWRYLTEKLFNMTVAQAVESEINIDSLNTKVMQLTSDNETQNQLLQHLISNHHTTLGIEVDECSKPSKSTGSSHSGSENSSAASSRSTSPTFLPPLSHSTTRLNPPGDPSSLLVKHRRKTALPQDLLYGADSTDRQENQLAMSKSLTHITASPTLVKLTSVRPAEYPTVNRRNFNEITSPRLARRTPNMASMSSAKSDLDIAADSPPSSPTTYRRFNSREENVFSRLTGGHIATDQPGVGRGTITPYTGKINPKAPLSCAMIASGHSRAVLSVAATDDLLFTASKDRSVKVWDLGSGVEIQSLTGHPNNVDVVKYCKESRLLFSVSSAYVKVWDLREAPSQCIKTLCSSGLTVNGSVSLTTPARTVTVPPGEMQLNDIAINHNGRIIYTAAGDRVRVWDLRKFSSTGKLAGGHQAAVMCIAVSKISETEDLVVTGSKDHYIKVFEVTGEGGGVFAPTMNLNPPHYDGIQSLAIQGDVLFSGSRDMCIKKWDLTRQELIQSINNAHANWICGLALMPGGQQLVSGCRSGSLKMWSVDSCNLIGEVKAHSSPINSVTVNSTHLFTASNDCSVRMWKQQQPRLSNDKSPYKEKNSSPIHRTAWVS